MQLRSRLALRAGSNSVLRFQSCAISSGYGIKGQQSVVSHDKKDELNSPLQSSARFSSSLSLAERRRRRILKNQKKTVKTKRTQIDENITLKGATAETPKKTFFDFNSDADQDVSQEVPLKPVKFDTDALVGEKTSNARRNLHRKRAVVPSVGDKDFDQFIKKNKSVNTPRGKNRHLKPAKPQEDKTRTVEEESAIDEAVAALVKANVEKAEVAVHSLKASKRTPARDTQQQGEGNEHEPELIEKTAKETLQTIASTPSGQKKVASAIARLQKSKVGRDLRRRMKETRKKMINHSKKEGFLNDKNNEPIIVQDKAKQISAIVETTADKRSTKEATGGKGKKGKRSSSTGSKSASSSSSAEASFSKKGEGNTVLTFPDHREKVISIFQQLAEINLALGEKYKTSSYQIAVERLKKDDFIFKVLPPNLIPLPQSYIELVHEYQTGRIENPSEKIVQRVREIEDNLGKRTQLLAVASSSSGSGSSNYLGVGDKLKKKIIEILKTGDLEEIHVFEAKPIIKAVRSISQVHGFGPRTALNFYKNYGIHSVEELKERVREQDELIASGKGIAKGKKKSSTFHLTDAQRVGLKYYKDIQLRIPHNEGRLHEAFLKLRLKKHLNVLNGGDANGPYQLVICGSYRRKCESSGDIDVLLTRTDMKRGKEEVTSPSDALTVLVQSLTKDEYLEAHLALGNTKYMGVCRLPAYEKDGKMRKFPARRIDIRYVDTLSFPAALCYFTGSKNFNVVMRAEAIKKGFILNEYGLFRQDKVESSQLHSMIQKLAKAQYYIGGNPDYIEETVNSEGAEDDSEPNTTGRKKKKPLTDKEKAELEKMHKVVESTRVKAKTEEDLFDAIGMAYVNPADRDV